MTEDGRNFFMQRRNPQGFHPLKCFQESSVAVNTFKTWWMGGGNNRNIPNPKLLICVKMFNQALNQ